MSKVLVIGSGAFGCALVQVLVSNNHCVDVYGVNENELQTLKVESTNPKNFNDEKLTKPINNIYLDLDLALTTNAYALIFIAVPASGFNEVINLLKKNKSQLTNTIVVNASKGLNQSTQKPWCFSLKEEIKAEAIVSLCGPSFAVDVFLQKPTMVNIISENNQALDFVQKALNNNWFKTIKSNDCDFASYVACFKNVLAIGCGLITGLYESKNSLSAFLVCGVNEINQILNNLFDKEVNLLQMYGLGDILLTCTDHKSRNFQLGYNIAKLGLDQALGNNTQTVEGYANLAVLNDLIKTNKIKASLFTTLYEIIYNQQSFDNLWKVISANL